jgi:MoxR-like ATPase
MSDFPNFIFTDSAINRLSKLCNYLYTGVPVLLEGPTGTSKSLSVEIICKLLKKK